MLFSKGNLTVRRVASRDESDRALCAVHFAADGATVASNGRTLMAVGPVDKGRVIFPDVGGDATPPSFGTSVDLDIVDTAMRNLPKDKRVSLQNVMMTICTGDKVEFTTVSTTKEQRVAGKPVRDRFPEWTEILKEAKAKAVVGRVCLNRRDLVELLQAMDDAVGEGDEGAVFVEFGGEGDGVLMRAINPGTAQQIIGLCMPLNTGGQWIRPDGWAKSVFGLLGKVLKQVGVGSR